MLYAPLELTASKIYRVAVVGRPLVKAEEL